MNAQRGSGEVESAPAIRFGRCLRWENTETWLAPMSDWLRPRLKAKGLEKARAVSGDLYDDDPEWTAVFSRICRYGFEFAADTLAAALRDEYVTVYHGCRTQDAGAYFRDGLRVHNREGLENLARAIVAEAPDLHWLLQGLTNQFERLNTEIDEGRCYVVLDRRGLLEDSAHYLIYGSEFVLAVLGHQRHILKRIGTPTLLEIELPLSICEFPIVRSFTQTLLQEWTRLTVIGKRVPLPIDFTFIVNTNIPAQCIVKHEHPVRLRDPIEGLSLYVCPRDSCDYCATPTVQE